MNGRNAGVVAIAMLAAGFGGGWLVRGLQATGAPAPGVLPPVAQVQTQIASEQHVHITSNDSYEAPDETVPWAVIVPSRDSVQGKWIAKGEWVSSSTLPQSIELEFRRNHGVQATADGVAAFRFEGIGFSGGLMNDVVFDSEHRTIGFYWPGALLSAGFKEQMEVVKGKIYEPSACGTAMLIAADSLQVKCEFSPNPDGMKVFIDAVFVRETSEVQGTK